jgi:hypothetical protein
MLFACRVLESIGLLVEKPMVIEVDNKGAVDLVNSWTATGRTRHIATRINFLRELKEEGTISVRWISNVAMSSDIFTKNVGGYDFYRHRDVYVREDPSVSCVAASTMTNPVGEGVGVRIHSNESTGSGTGLGISRRGSKNISESTSAGTEVVEVEAADSRAEGRDPQVAVAQVLQKEGWGFAFAFASVMANGSESRETKISLV